MKTLFAAAVLATCATSAWAAGTPCDQLASLKLPHSEITAAILVAQGAFTPPATGQQQAGPPPAPAGNPAPGAPAAAAPNGRAQQNAVYKAAPAFCRVSITSRPSSDSDIKIEVWLPAQGWNNRVEELGNGGFGSNISFNGLAEAVAKGYVATANNTGHDTNNGDPMIGHPEKLKDWGYRAMHEGVVSAKAVAAAFYGSAPKYSYYSGCSTGGRQGWVAAEYYPGDFDGLAIGDPANPMTRLQAGSIWSNEVVNRSEDTYISNAKWKMIHDAVLEECDAVDGLKDGLIENPMACNFKPESLLCKNGDAADCLTAPQVDSMKKVMSGAVNPRTGEQIYPGWPAGTVMVPGPVLAKTPQQDAIDTFRILFGKSDWDFHTMDFDKDIALSDKLGNDTMNAADESRLKPLFARGGKVLLYHGWEDPAITPLIQIDYYDKTVKANGGLAKTYNDIRLFLAPGMSHCGNGEGPNAFDKLDVISDWVEHGKAPDQIVASHSTNGKIDRTRPLCPYPQIAKYKGSGSIDEAQNFVCAAP